MTTYTLKNFIGLILGIKKDYIEIENGSNIDFHILDDNRIILGYSNTAPKMKTLDLISTLSQVIKSDNDIGDYEVLLGDVCTEEFCRIEMIDTNEDSIILGKETTYNSSNNPRNEWYFSDNRNALTFENDNYQLIINHETYENDSLGFSLFVRDKNGNVSDNKFTYFGSHDSLVNRFDFNEFKSTSPDSSLLEVLKFSKLHPEMIAQ